MQKIVPPFEVKVNGCDRGQAGPRIVEGRPLNLLRGGPDVFQPPLLVSESEFHLTHRGRRLTFSPIDSDWFYFAAGIRGPASLDCPEPPRPGAADRPLRLHRRTRDGRGSLAIVPMARRNAWPGSSPTGFSKIDFGLLGFGGPVREAPNPRRVFLSGQNRGVVKRELRRRSAV